jgi:hypothetical protein
MQMAKMEKLNDCAYLLEDNHALFVEQCREVGAMLGSMISDPSSFILKPISDVHLRPLTSDF